MTLAVPSAASPQASARPGISRRRKAAIIVRLLLSEGTALPLDTLPPDMQTALTEEIGAMRYIDAETLRQVVGEFLTELSKVGLTFPGGLDGALDLLKDHISPDTAAQLKPDAGPPDPWPRLAALEVEALVPILSAESTEVAAVVLSKLDTQKSAQILSQIPGEQARRIAYAVSQIGHLKPAMMDRIGRTLADAQDQKVEGAFDSPAEDRVGAILNLASSATRDSVLDGLDSTDSDFAARVRKAIFTFDDIPTRVPERQVPSITRAVEQTVLITALTGAKGVADAAVDYILSNMSQRMADQLREEMEERGKVKLAEAEAAMAEIVLAIRNLEAEGEITLINPDEEEEEE